MRSANRRLKARMIDPLISDAGVMEPDNEYPGSELTASGRQQLLGNEGIVRDLVALAKQQSCFRNERANVSWIDFWRGDAIDEERLKDRKALGDRLLNDAATENSVCYKERENVIDSKLDSAKVLNGLADIDHEEAMLFICEAFTIVRHSTA